MDNYDGHYDLTEKYNKHIKKCVSSYILSVLLCLFPVGSSVYLITVQSWYPLIFTSILTAISIKMTYDIRSYFIESVESFTDYQKDTIWRLKVASYDSEA